MAPAPGAGRDPSLRSGGSYSELGFAQRAKMDFAEEALRALGDNGGDGVSDIFGAQHFRRVFGAAAGKFGGYAARANHADADAMFTKIFGHTSGESEDAPFRSAINAAAGKGIFSCEGTDVNDIAATAADHGRHNGAGNEKNAFEIGIQHAIPIGICLFMGGTEESDAGVVDEDGDGAERRFRLCDEAGDFGRFGDVGDLRMHRHAGISKRLCGSIEPGAIASANGDGGSHSSQPQSDGVADSTAGPRDESDCAR